MYAQLCKRLSDEAPNFEPPEKRCTFLRLLLNVCRDKFENRSAYLSELLASTSLSGAVGGASALSSSSNSSNNSSSTNGQDVDAETQQSEEEERKHIAKQKMLGNVKFIGELSKLGMLSSATLHKCIQELLDRPQNRQTATIHDRCEDMECLSQLIRTCGENLDTEKCKPLMDQYFEKMTRRSQSAKYPPRIRFMLRDVIELRRDNWVPRKVATTEGPVPINQLRQEEDLLVMRTPYNNRNHRDGRNIDRDNDNWMKFAFILQPGFSDSIGGGPNSIMPSAPSPYSASGDRSSGNSYMNNRDRDHQSSYNNHRQYRDDQGGGNNSQGQGGGMMDSRQNMGGNYRHNNQRGQNNYNNNRYNNSGGGGGNNQNMNNTKHNMHHQYQNQYHGGQHNNHNNYNSNNMSSNMLNNKDLAPRFKRSLITPSSTEAVEKIQFRPAANTLLFKANANIKATQLPLTTPRSGSASTTMNNGSTSLSETTQSQQPSPLPTQPAEPQHQQQQQQPQQQQQQQPIARPTQAQSPSLQEVKVSDNKQPPTGINNKEQTAAVVKQGSVEKPKQKKDKGPNKEETLKKVSAFVVESIVPELPEDKQLDAVAAEFIEMKIPEKFMRDSMILTLNEIIDKDDIVHERTISFLMKIRAANKLSNGAVLDAFKSLINGMNESPIPRVATLMASLLARSVASNLCKLSDVALYCENGQHYPLFLLVLQQLHKSMGKQPLYDIFTSSKVNLMTSLPDADRNKERMGAILEDRNLSFLYPLLKVQAEMQKQIQTDPNPQVFYKWIKENVDADRFTDPRFITALMTVLLKYITTETTLADGVDRTKMPERLVIDKEKTLLEKYRALLLAFLNRNTELQLIAIYALQVFCHSVKFPKGMLLRWFSALYELNVISEESFLNWKEDLSNAYPGKGDALFQVNQWLTWLAEAESEDDEDED